MQYRYLRRCLILVSLWLGLGCAPALKFPPGQAVLQEGKAAEGGAPESLRAKLKTTVVRKGDKSTLTVLISALPLEKYRLEFKGPLGSHLGDLYWVKDSNWILSIPSEDLYLVGREREVRLPGLVLDSLDIHYILGFLWGALIPAGTYQIDSAHGRGVLGRGDDGSQSGARGFLADAKSGQVRWTKYGSYYMEYSKYSEKTGKVLPHQIKLFKNRELLLEWNVQKIEFNPQWRRTPFRAPPSPPG